MIFIILFLSLFNLSNAEWQRNDSPMENNFVDFMFQKGDTIVATYQLEFYIKIGDKPWELVESNYNKEKYKYNIYNHLAGDELFKTVVRNSDDNLIVLNSTDFGKNWTEFLNITGLKRFNIQATDKNIYIPINEGILKIDKLTRKITDTLDIILEDEWKSQFKCSENIILYTKRINIGQIHHDQVFISSDEGENFELILDIENYITLTEIVKNNILICTRNHLYISKDFGKTFSKFYADDFISKYDYISYFNDKFYLNKSSNAYEIDLENNTQTKVFELNTEKYVNGPFLLNDKIVFSTGCHHGHCYLHKTVYFENGKTIDLGFERHNYHSNFYTYNNDLYLLSDYGIYKYINSKWEKIITLDGNLINNKNQYFFHLFVDENIIVLYSKWNVGIFYTTDNGQNWIKDDLDYLHVYKNIKNIYKIQNSYFLIAEKSPFDDYDEKMIFISQDKFQTWNSIYSENPNFKYIVLNLIMYKNNLYATTLNNGIISSEDGINWEKISNHNDIIIEEKINTFTKSDSIFIAFGDKSQKLLKSENNGKDWSEVINSPNITSVSHLKSYKNNFFMFANNGFYYSTDNGDNWTEHSSGLNKVKDPKYFAEKIKEVELFDNKIFIIDSTQIFTLELEELGINLSVESEKNEFNIKSYPQPAKNEFVLEIDNLANYIDIENVSLISTTGEEIDIQNLISIEKLNGKTLINIKSSNISNGIYFIKINQEDIDLNHKIIISN